MVKSEFANGSRTITSKDTRTQQRTPAPFRCWRWIGCLEGKAGDVSPTDAKRPVGVISLIGGYGGTPSQECFAILVRN